MPPPWTRGVPIAQRGPGESYRPEPIGTFHPPGVATRVLDHLAFAALEGTDGLAELWERAEAMTRDGLTVTVGLGPGAFARRERPFALAELPPFRGDDLAPATCGGDVCVQVCGDERAAADDALAALTAGAAVRWSQAGVGGPRTLLGFRDGLAIPRRGKELDRHVWVGRGDRSWMAGGTYLVVRRIRVDLAAWRALSMAEQERVIGRHRASGAPLGHAHRFERMPLEGDAIPADAHARVAAPSRNGGIVLLRRAYSYEGGLVLLLYQRDPRRQFVPLQRRLAERDALRDFTTTVGSAVFAIPPRAGSRPTALRRPAARP